MIKVSIYFFFLKEKERLKISIDTVKQLLLSGPRAHLFYLYPSLCSMITCEDEVVVSLIKECLHIVGIEMGLST